MTHQPTQAPVIQRVYVEAVSLSTVATAAVAGWVLGILSVLAVL